MVPTFLDITGQKRAIAPLPLPARSPFRSARERLLILVSLYPPGTELSRLYDEFDGSTEFREAVDEALGCFQISPEWITASMLRDLLFEPDGGVLWQLEFAYG